MSVVSHIIRYFAFRKKKLDAGWYKNLTGGITHRRCMECMTPKDIWEATAKPN